MRQLETDSQGVELQALVITVLVARKAKRAYTAARARMRQPDAFGRVFDRF